MSFWSYDRPVWQNILAVILGLAVVLGIAFGIMCLSAWLIMLLWNAILPAIIGGVSIITFWQAFGLDLLVSLLFGGLGKTVSKIIKISSNND